MEGTCEVSIVKIQYHSNWPNFNEEFVAFIVSVKESEAEKEMQKKQQATEGDIPLAYFKAQCRLSSMPHPLDPNAEKLYDYANEYAKQIGRVSDGTKLMKKPTGYDDSPVRLGKYLEKEFSKNLPIKGHYDLSACQIHSSYDNVTQRISLSTKCIVDFHMSSLNGPLIAHIGAVCTPCDNKIFITDPYCFGVRRAFLQKYRTMYIYWDAVTIK